MDRLAQLVQLFIDREVLRFILVLMLVKVETILYSLKLMVSLNTKDLVKTRNRYLFTL